KACALPENPAGYRHARPESDLFNKARQEQDAAGKWITRRFLKVRVNGVPRSIELLDPDNPR
ncbi:hypothetical protein, partial [Pantoea dispersa]|uniref:hypothetical protein n=1 Tax=Pantoea dispersa TaxID=59814 RepID=UPI00163A8BB8